LKNKIHAHLNNKLTTILSRLLQLTLSFVVLFIFVFLLLRQLPTDIAQSENAVEQSVAEQIRNKLQLNEKGHLSFSNYLQNLVSGNLGLSFSRPGRTVEGLILEGSQVTFVMAIVAFLFSVFCSYFLIVISRVGGISIRKFIDYLLMAVSSVPLFCIVPLLIWYVAVAHDLFPLVFDGSLSSWCLPVFLLSIKPTVSLARHLGERMDADHYSTGNQWLRSLGFSELKIIGYFSFLKTSSGYFSQMSLVLIHLLSGSFFVENIYGISGLGRLTLESVMHRDWPLLMGLTLWVGMCVMLVHFLFDMVALFVIRNKGMET
jgi:oligopeptide transport system permease protein